MNRDVDRSEDRDSAREKSIPTVSVGHDPMTTVKLRKLTKSTPISDFRGHEILVMLSKLDTELIRLPYNALHTRDRRKTQIVEFFCFRVHNSDHTDLFVTTLNAMVLPARSVNLCRLDDIRSIRVKHFLYTI